MLRIFIVALMMCFFKKLRRHFLETYCFSYGIFRFILEFFRHDDRGSTGFSCPPSQLMSIILLIAGVLLILYHKQILFKKLYAKMQAYREEGRLYGHYVRMDIKHALRKLQALQKDGVITEKEYTEAEDKLLARITQAPAIEQERSGENSEQTQTWVPP